MTDCQKFNKCVQIPVGSVDSLAVVWERLVVVSLIPLRVFGHYAREQPIL